MKTDHEFENLPMRQVNEDEIVNAVNEGVNSGRFPNGMACDDVALTLNVSPDCFFCTIAQLADSGRLNEKDFRFYPARLCRIEMASLEDAETGAGDGAYDLHDIDGTPEAIGRAIADSLQTSDLWNPSQGGAIAFGETLRLNLSILVKQGQTPPGVFED